MKPQLFLTFLLKTGLSLKCFTCNNARNNEECNRMGKDTKCFSNENVCMNEVRHFSMGNGVNTQRITKMCKSRHACINLNAQNWAGVPPIQCDPNRNYGSVCRCCCDTDNCNFMAYSQACLNDWG